MSVELPLLTLYDFMAWTGITVPCTVVSYSIQFLFIFLFTVIRNFDSPIALLWDTSNGFFTIITNRRTDFQIYSCTKLYISISSFYRASLLSVTFISRLMHSNLDVVDIKICVI
jgi:hypothetical protein